MRFFFFLYKLKVFGKLRLSKFTDVVFLAACAHFLTVSHFGNSHNISKIFIINTSVTEMLLSELILDHESLPNKMLISADK
jgi:hypothetical protein